MTTTAPIRSILLIAILSCFTATASHNRAMAGDVKAGAVSQTGELAEWQRLRKAGVESLNLGNYPSAESLLEQAVKKASGASPEEACELRTELGEAYLWQAKISDASSMLSKAQGMAKKLNQGQNLQMARIQDDMSWLLEAQGKPDKASAACDEALALRKKYLPMNDPLIAESLEHLGWLRESRGMLDDALSSYAEALGLRTGSQGADSLACANIMERMASIKFKQGKSDAAQQLYLQALSIKTKRGAEFKPFVPHPDAENVVYNFLPGAPYCATSSEAGSILERITANNVSIEAGITVKPTEFAKTISATIRIVNQGNQPIDLLTQPASFMVLKPKVKMTTYLEGDALAQKVEQTGQKKADSIRRSGEHATTSLTTTVVNPQPPRYYYGAAPFGYVPTPMRNKNWNPFWGNNQTSFYTTQVPDMQARARAYVKADQVQSRSASDADVIRQSALGPQRILPGGMAAGALNFTESKFDEAILTVPVGNAVYEFHFDRTPGG